MTEQKHKIRLEINLMNSPEYIYFISSLNKEYLHQQLN